MVVINKKSFEYNGYNFKELVPYVKTERPIHPDRINNLAEGVGATGSRYLTYRYDSIVIPMRIGLRIDDVPVFKRKFAELLHVEEPQRLIFYNEPDKYYLAVVDGLSEFEEIGKMCHAVINWLVPDGVAYSIDPKEFSLSVSDSEQVFKIINRGTYKARPSFEFDILKDTDGFGLVSGDQVLQLGTIETVDINDFKPQEIIWKDDLTPATQNKWKPNIALPNFSTSDDRLSKVMGTMNWSGTAFVPATFGATDPKEKGFWHGPSESRYTGKVIADWSLYTRVSFKPTPNNVKGKKRNEQQGLQEVNAYDLDNNLICGFHFKDNTQAADLVEYRVYLAGVLVYTNKLLRASHTEDGGFYGFLWIRKFGNSFKLELVKEVKGRQTWVKNLSFTNEDAARLELNRVDYWMAQWGGRPAISMAVTYSTLIQNNVEDEKDIPLKFYEGDKVLIDSDTGKIYINGAERPDYFIDGSKFIECLPGTTDIYMVAADDAVTGKAILKEKYL